MLMLRAAPTVILGFLIAACSPGEPQEDAAKTEIPEEIASDETVVPINADELAAGATPMEERVATIGLLNKRNNVSEDFEIKPGETRRSGSVIIRLQACERTAPWEMPEETGAFVQVLVQERGEDDFDTVFSGWLFKNSPSLNVVEHPIYDVWVKDCEMAFPGEE